VYAFADADATALADWAARMTAPDSPLSRATPAGADVDAVFDVKVIYPQSYDAVDIAAVPGLFLPKTGPLGLTDWEKVFAAGPSGWNTVDIFTERQIDRAGVVVVVRPDQYVAAVLPLSAPDELTAFLDGAVHIPAKENSAV
jgi:phenol 2-monooxygenase